MCDVLSEWRVIDENGGTGGQAGKHVTLSSNGGTGGGRTESSSRGEQIFYSAPNRCILKSCQNGSKKWTDIYC